MLNQKLTTEQRQEMIIEALKALKDFAIEEYKGYKILTYITKTRDLPAMGILGIKDKKLTDHYAFRSVEQRQEKINSIKNNIDNAEQTKLLWDAKLKGMSDQIQPGCILYSSWGWEQTNINFYKVISRKNMTVEVVEIGQHRTYQRQDSGNCTPNVDKTIGEPFKKRITKYGGIKINEVASAYIYDGGEIGWSSYA